MLERWYKLRKTNQNHNFGMVKTIQQAPNDNQPSALFFYRHKQRTTAKRIALNMVLLLLMYSALVKFDDGSSAYAELVDIGLYALIAAECVLLGLGIYFWRNNKAFTIYLTPELLSIFDPLFGDHSWQVNVSDIIRIDHDFDAHTKMSQVVVNMQNGERHILTQNYAFSRADLYAELSQLNPNIKMPKSSLVFTKHGGH